MSEYEVELFREQGFDRRRCQLCNKFFWTLGGRETCGEPPCEEYSFIGDPPTKKSMDLSEMRESYLSFFEKHGHKRVPRYPIVARWRDDIFFTIASISCFQPWVLNRTIEPPANPLVISQTCLRFNDIDNVGKTGRHLTEFEMMAHHAFNSEEKFVYFKDRTVELCHKLLLDLGINADEIQYIEAEWSGGGNSGPCFEVIVRGVELATLVFMMYRDTPSGRGEMDMQVVDTGYGLERFVWISQGTPNAYEAIFGDVLVRLKGEADIQADDGLMAEYSKLAGMMNVESNADLRVLREKVAKRMQVPLKEIIERITPLEHIYAVCDHTRALMFMLNDGGIVPSNAKAGYFARLLARKTLRSLDSLGLSFPLSEILGMQIDYSGRDFPELAENREDVLNLVDVEEKKYRKTMDRGKGIVGRIDAELGDKGENRINTEELIHLYDSHGITPEIVAEFSMLKVDIPDDFYIQVAGRHEKPEREDGVEGVRVPRVEPTELGFYEDAYVREFKANVLRKFNNNIILDKTYFYAEGGGQEADHGWIGPLKVVDVQKHGNVVLHGVEGDLGRIGEGETVECSIDWNRRLQLMQHHTVTHIINGAARRVLGNHAWQAGAHKSEELGRLDLTHHSRITGEEREQIETLSNKVIAEKRPVQISFMERDKAEKKYGFRIYQGGAVPGGIIRIVDIVDWDVEACGGMHFKNTSEVGYIRITDIKRIQDGVVRIEYKAGVALKDHVAGREKLAGEIGLELSERELQEIAEIFSVQVAQLPKTIERFRGEWISQKEELEGLYVALSKLIDERKESIHVYGEMPSGEPVQAHKKLFDEWKTQRKEIEGLKCKIREALSRRLDRRFQLDYVEKDGVKIVKELVSGLDVKNLIELAKSTTRENSLLIIANTGDGKANILVYSKSIFKADELAKKLSEKLGGGAHGDAVMAVGGGSSENVEKILEEFQLG
ncbi:MAG: alanine--tRNA ligase [Candidatus Altiarchaeota archaeon]|nr:alanine--tRNA ligase [Candidatus Altiarchaeota archaeon]